MRLFLLPVVLALRDLRGGLGALWFVVLQVALAVALMAGFSVLAAGALEALDRVGREAVGGDLSVRLFHAPASEAQRQALRDLGALSVTTEARPVAVAPDGGRALVELKAVDEAYPLYGTLSLVGGGDPRRALAETEGAWGTVVGPELLERLSLTVGDRLRLGTLTVTIRGVLDHEPDRLLRALSLGPRVILSQAALPRTGLVQPGAPIYWYYRLRLPEEADVAAMIATLGARFPDAGWRIVNGREGLPGAERVVHMARALFLLTATAVLLVGGIGIGNAVRRYLAVRLPSAATLKVLGARPRLVFVLFLVQVMAASLVAGLLGAALGLAGAAAALGAAPAWLAGTAEPWQPGALAVAVGVGVLATLAFALPPLIQAAGQRPSEVWRDMGLSPGHGGWWGGAGALVLGLATVGLVGAWSGAPAVTAAVLLAGAVAAWALAGVGRGLAALGRRQARARRGGMRMALANLGRPGAPTVPVTVVLGLALMVVVGIGATGRAALHHMAATLPAAAPDALVLSLPEGDDTALRGRLAALPGVSRVDSVPFLHARISRLKGVPVGEADVPRSVAWAVRGDRGLSWRRRPPPETEITAGAWWPAEHAGPPLASVDARVAARLDLSVGDTLTLATPAGPVTATVANLRRVDWTSLDLDFPILLSPPAAPPPHSRVAAIWAAPEALAAVEAVVARAEPTAPVLRLAPILRHLEAAVAQVRTLLAGVAAVTLVSAGLVLAATVLASAGARRREAAILRAVGVAPAQIARASALEFALLGLAVAVLAVPPGAAIGAAVALAVTGTAAVDVALAAVAVGGTVAVMAAVGLLVARDRPGRTPAATLRQSMPAG